MGLISAGTPLPNRSLNTNMWFLISFYKFSYVVFEISFFAASAMRSFRSCSISSGLSSSKSTHVFSLISPLSSVPSLLCKSDRPNSALMFPCRLSYSSLPSFASLLAFSIHSPYLSHADVNISLLSHPEVSRAWHPILSTETVPHTTFHSTFLNTKLFPFLILRNFSNHRFSDPVRQGFPLALRKILLLL